MKPIKSADQIYDAIETALAKANAMQTCADLMENPEVRAAAIDRFGKDIQVTTNKMSDTLGFMWRRGILDRFPAPPSRSMARFAYALKNKIAEAEPIRFDQTPKLGKHALGITERDGEVILDFQQFTIIVRPK